MNDELMETFESKSAELYMLAYLLTGDENRSVEALSNALDVSEGANSAFHGFMSDWARKLVAAEALGTMQAELRQSKARVARTGSEGVSGTLTPREGIARKEFEEAVVAIDAFPRCAMLLTVFEGMTKKAAAALLNSTEALIAVAQRIGIVQLTRNLAGARVPALSPGF